MRNSEMKVLLAAVIAAISFLASNAFAQSGYNQNNPSPQNKEQQQRYATNQPADALDNRPGLVIRGGYNVGRTSVQNVPGCVGPTSFCNMYFGN